MWHTPVDFRTELEGGGERRGGRTLRPGDVGLMGTLGGKENSALSDGEV